MATPLLFPRFKAFVQGTNAPLAGGKVYFYAAGTSTPLATYTDATLGTANANPVILDANGEASIFPGPYSYKIVVKDASDVTQSTTDSVSASSTVVPSVSGRNFLTDGGFELWQESASYTGAATLKVNAAWSVAITSGTASNFTISRQASGLTNSAYCLRIQRNPGATDAGMIFLIQDLESVDSIALQDQQCALSLYARAGATASFSPIAAFVYGGTGTDEAWRTSRLYTGQSTILSGLTITTLTTWAQSLATSSGAASTSINQVGVAIGPIGFFGTAGATDYVDFDDIQLELGTTHTNFERLPMDELIRRDQRRYYKSFQIATYPANAAATAAAFHFTQPVGAAATMTSGEFPAPGWMRDVAGTLTTYNPVNNNAQAYNVTRSADCSAISGVVNIKSAYANLTSAAGSAAGDVNAVHYTLDRRI